MRRIVLACVALAALSLLLPSQPSYDPWAWIVWGREIATGSLDTAGGPSWKPGTVVFTTAFAPFGKVGDGIPPALWLIVARTGGLLALVFAFRLARRLAGNADAATAVAAGLLAALALALTPQWLRYLAHGNEAPLAVALMLWGVERHLDGNRRQALLLAFAACLLRPEVFAFLAPYGAWLAWRDPRERPLLAGLALALPALWLLPDWIGSGNPLNGGSKAASEPSWSLSLRDHPWLAALERLHGVVGLPVELGAAAAAAFAAARRERLTLALAGVAVGWTALVCAMTQAGFSGNARYFLPAVVILCVLAGVGAARAVAAAPRLFAVAPRPVVAAGAAALLAIAATPYLIDRGDRFAAEVRASRELARLQAQLPTVVRAAGGADRVVAVGAPSINRTFMTRLAWETRLTLADVERARGDAIIFSSRARMSGVGAVVDPAAEPLHTLARWGSWHVLRAANTAPRQLARAP
jgi:hypothetical protein